MKDTKYNSTTGQASFVKMLTDSSDIHKVCKDVKEHYDDKNDVTVAPCRCKLYVSRSTKIVDYEGTASSNWFLFASGVAALVYNKNNNEVMLNLHDIATAKLLWMYKLTSESQIHAPDSSFHVINTRSNFREHIGLSYDDKEVAKMFLKKLTKSLKQRATATSTVPESKTSVLNINSTSGNDITNNNLRAKKTKPGKLFRSLSLLFKRSSKDKDNDQSHETTASAQADGKSPTSKKIFSSEPKYDVTDHDSATKATNAFENLGRSDKRRHWSATRSHTIEAASSIKWPMLRKGERNDNSYRNSSPNVMVNNTEETVSPRHRESPLRIARNSSYHASSNSSYAHRDPTFGQNTNASRVRVPGSPQILNQSKGVSCESTREQVRKKVNRSMSERSAGARPRVPVAAVAMPSGHNENIRYRRTQVSKRDDRPRATSDSLLHKDSIMEGKTEAKIETGSRSDYQRDRGHWMSILENDSVMTTDLCVSEL